VLGWNARVIRGVLIGSTVADATAKIVSARDPALKDRATFTMPLCGAIRRRVATVVSLREPAFSSCGDWSSLVSPHRGACVNLSPFLFELQSIHLHRVLSFLPKSGDKSPHSKIALTCDAHSIEIPLLSAPVLALLSEQLL